MTHLVIPINNQYSYNNIPRNKDLDLQINNHCDMPYKTLLVDWNGNCFVCSCEAWLPISVGKITDFNKLSDIWDSSTAKILQQDISDYKFTHCAVDRCGILHTDIVQKNYTISINIDESCNLICPSCRRNSIMLTNGDDYDQRLSQVNHLVELLEQFDKPAHIVMSGNGDPLASAVMRPLLHRFKPKTHQTIRLFTNGLLLEKQLYNNTIVEHITEYFISVDAGSQPVYEQVRRPGRWDHLISNLSFLQTLTLQTKAHVLLKFVLQKNNFNDIGNFAELCLRFGFNGVINKLEDWGTWNNFLEHDVIGNNAHPNHTTAIELLQNMYQKYCNKIQFDSNLIQLATETT